MPGAYTPNNEQSGITKLFRAATVGACSTAATFVAGAALMPAAEAYAAVMPDNHQASVLFATKIVAGIASLAAGGAAGITAAYATRNKNQYNFG